MAAPIGSSRSMRDKKRATCSEGPLLKRQSSAESWWSVGGKDKWRKGHSVSERLHSLRGRGSAGTERQAVMFITDAGDTSSPVGFTVSRVGFFIERLYKRKPMGLDEVQTRLLVLLILWAYHIRKLSRMSQEYLSQFVCEMRKVRGKGVRNC